MKRNILAVLLAAAVAAGTVGCFEKKEAVANSSGKTGTNIGFLQNTSVLCYSIIRSISVQARKQFGTINNIRMELEWV